MKQAFFALLVVALLLSSALPAFAANSSAPGKNTVFTLSGKITAIQGSTITVKVLAGKPAVRPYIGQTLEIQTTDSTRFLLKTATDTMPISLADLAVDQNVSVQGQVANSVWTATRITVGANLIHQ